MLDFIIGLITGIPASAYLIAAGILVVTGIFDRNFRTHITYTLVNAETGQVYVGRTSGYGEPERIVRWRMHKHKYFKRGFTEITYETVL